LSWVLACRLRCKIHSRLSRGKDVAFDFQRGLNISFHASKGVLLCAS